MIRPTARSAQLFRSSRGKFSSFKVSSSARGSAPRARGKGGLPVSRPVGFVEEAPPLPPSPPLVLLPTAIPCCIYRISSDLRGLTASGPVSTGMIDLFGIPGVIGFGSALEIVSIDRAVSISRPAPWADAFTFFSPDGRLSPAMLLFFPSSPTGVEFLSVPTSQACCGNVPFRLVA